MRILGIESSCDETAASVVEDGRRILSNVVHSQIDQHEVFGGVVPEVAARSHIEMILPVIDRAVIEAYINCHPELKTCHSEQSEESLPEKRDSATATGSSPALRLTGMAGEDLREKAWSEIDAIAATTMPGLIGSLLIGALAGRTLALIKDKPFLPVHHVEAHVYANFLTEEVRNDNVEILRQNQPEFPMLALIVSGGHSQIVLFKNHGDYRLLGQTQDDAVGEAFDKVAKILGLPYPGGPAIDRAAKNGDPHKYKFPKARMQNPYDFSFSGLKTAVLRAVQAEVGVDHTFPSSRLAERLTASQRDNFAASFQKIAVETLVEKVVAAYREFAPKSVVIAGGVAASRSLRYQLREKLPIPIEYPPMEFCTDNAAMVASLGYFMAQKIAPADSRDVDVTPSISMTKTAWNLEKS